MSEWENHCKRLIEVERKRQIVQAFLSQFWIWQPYSKHSLSSFELLDRGYKNLGNNKQQQKGNQNES